MKIVMKSDTVVPAFLEKNKFPEEPVKWLWKNPDFCKQVTGEDRKICISMFVVSVSIENGQILRPSASCFSSLWMPTQTISCVSPRAPPLQSRGLRASGVSGSVPEVLCVHRDRYCSRNFSNPGLPVRVYNPEIINAG
jgi:hypothetical protein